MTTGTRTQVADTFRSGMPRILRDSLRTFSSSEDQPSSLREPAHGTTFSASGAGNGDVPRQARPRRAPRRRRRRARPTSLPATRRDLGVQPVDARAGPRPTPPGTTRRPAPRASNSRCSAPSAAIIDSVVQLGFAMIPLGRCAAASALTSGTTSGTSGSIRKAPELSTATAPRSAAIGRPLRADLVRHVEQRDVHAVEDLGRERLHGDVRARAPGCTLPAERGEAIEPDLAPRHGLARVDDVDHRGADGAGGPDDRDDRSRGHLMATAPFPRARRRARPRPVRTPRAARARRRRAAPRGRSPRCGSRRCSSSRC